MFGASQAALFVRGGHSVPNGVRIGGDSRSTGPCDAVRTKDCSSGDSAPSARRIPAHAAQMLD